MNLKKLKGIAMITNAVFPVLGGVVILVILTTIVFDFKHLVKGPAKQLGRSLTSVSTKVSQTADAIGSAAKPVADLQQKLADLVQKIDRIPEHIEVPKVHIPNINLRIKPRVTVAGSSFTSGHNLADQAGDRSIFVNSAVAEHQPEIRYHNRHRLGFFRAAFSKPKIPSPSIPKPRIPRPPIPSVKVNWDNLSVRMPVIPSTRIPAPGLKQARSLLSQNADILSVMHNLLGISPLLNSLQASVKRILEEEQGFIRTVSALSGKLLALYLILTVFASILVVRLYVVPYCSWIWRQFTTGLALVRDQ